MNLAWCMIALTVAGADDQKYGTPPIAGIAPAANEAKASEPQERWPLGLAMATHIAFDNSEHFRVVEFGVCGLGACFPLHPDGPLTIARLNADTPLAKFKADAMALVHSVERDYWKLFQAQVALESAEQAVAMTQKLLEKAQAELGGLCRGPGVQEVAEAAQRLEQFHNELTIRKDDVKTAERALRNVLGLPLTDNRRIVATTKPIDGRISFDWDACVEEMSREQPDNLEQQAIGRLAELGLLWARNRLIYPLDTGTQRQLAGLGPSLDSTEAVLLGCYLRMFSAALSATERIEGIDPGGNAYLDSLTWQRGLTDLAPMGTGRSRMVNIRQAQYVLMRTRARQRHVFEQTARSLSRAFLDVDDRSSQYRVAQRLKAAAAHRLDVQRGSYDEGRITLDRLLDAVSKNDEAIAAEARHKSSYNVALTAFCEAKGTLLADRDIAIAEGPKRVRPVPVAQTTAVSPRR